MECKMIHLEKQKNMKKLKDLNISALWDGEDAAALVITR